MTFELKECKPADLDTLVAVSIETFTDTFADQNTPENMAAYLNSAYQPEKLLGEMDNPHSKFYFAYAGDEVAGYLKINIEDAQSEPLGSDRLEVERIYIRSKFKLQGIGRLLIEEAIAKAKARGKQYIWLGVWEYNHNALRFYERMGFKRVGEHAFYMGDDKQTDYIMAKAL